MFGLLLKSILAVGVYRSNPYIQRCKGHFSGILKIMTGRALILKGFSK
jgi:hypothetical protein